MVEHDDLGQVANRLKNMIELFCKRENGLDTLKQALGTILE
jgi:hypothetical protein